jgi:hypothetical protein
LLGDEVANLFSGQVSTWARISSVLAVGVELMQFRSHSGA